MVVPATRQTSLPASTCPPYQAAVTMLFLTTLLPLVSTCPCLQLACPCGFSTSNLKRHTTRFTTINPPPPCSCCYLGFRCQRGACGFVTHCNTFFTSEKVKKTAIINPASLVSHVALLKLQDGGASPESAYPPPTPQ